MLRRRARHRDADRARLAVFVATAALAGGCGGDDGSSTSTTVTDEALTRAEFLAEAELICRSGNAQLEAAADDLLTARPKPPPAEVRRTVLGIAVPALEARVRAIGALGTPEGDEVEVERILAATERAIAELEADPAAALDGPPPALREAGRLARRYGSQQCGVR